MSPASYRETFRIPATHPAFPGHFPGQPVVPGVVLLDRVAAALERWRGERIGAMAQVKFLRPLLPDQDAELVLDAAGAGVRFTIVHDAAVVATGSIEGVA
jgi:3-hydroxyacyl-[acyl-carrier-protein] dehydratase